MASKNRNAFCSFCKKSYKDVGPLVEGPGDVYICAECIELCQSIIDQEKRRRERAEAPPDKEADWVNLLLNYFIEGMAKGHWKPQELALLKEIANKIHELNTLVAGRTDSHGSSEKK